MAHRLSMLLDLDRIGWRVEKAHLQTTTNIRRTWRRLCKRGISSVGRARLRRGKKTFEIVNLDAWDWALKNALPKDVIDLREYHHAEIDIAKIPRGVRVWQ